MTAPEEEARRTIDTLLTAAGWAVQDFKLPDIHAARGVAIREFQLEGGSGAADVIEARGATLAGVEVHSG